MRQPAPTLRQLRIEENKAVLSVKMIATPLLFFGALGVLCALMPLQAYVQRGDKKAQLLLWIDGIYLLIIFSLYIMARRGRFEMFLDFDSRTIRVEDVRGMDAVKVWEGSLTEIASVDVTRTDNGAHAIEFHWADETAAAPRAELDASHDAAVLTFCELARRAGVEVRSS